MKIFFLHSQKNGLPSILKINRWKTKTKKIMTFLLGAFLILGNLLPPHPISAQNFNPHNVILDSELFDKDSMSQASIQQFLVRKNSVLARYIQNINGQNKNAAQIIWETSQKFGISPKFLLATLEKEQGLIRKVQATEKELERATGYGCYGGSCKEKHLGFANQLESTAETQKIYLEKAGTFKFQLNKPAKTFDGFEVTPENQATVNLYIYTPYVGNTPEFGIKSKYGGVRLFWLIWNRYFTEKKYPNGLVITDSKNFWLIQSDKKRKFASREIFLADYKETEAILTSQRILDAYENGPTIHYANNTLVRSSNTNQAYLLHNGEKRLVSDDAALALLNNFRLAISSSTEIPAVSHETLIHYKDGEPITASSRYPQGKLFRDETGKIYYIQDGLKSLVDESVWKINYSQNPPEPTTQDFLNQFLTRSPAKIKDGTFVKNSTGSIYLISDGKKIKIEVDALNKFFGQDKIQIAALMPDTVLALHEDGINIDYADDTIKDAQNTVVLPPPITQIYNTEYKDLVPSSIIVPVGQSRDATVIFANTGNVEWKKDDIWLLVNESLEKIRFTENSVAPNSQATFKIKITAGEKIGVDKVKFTIFRNEGGQAKEMTSVGKFILVKGGGAAQIVNHNIPIAVKNKWKPLPITLKVKNTSKDITWTAKKTALKITDISGNQSPFYDPGDWIKKDIAAIPMNKKSVKPGDTAELKFTLKLKDVKAGTYDLRFQLELTNQDEKNKQVFINGEETFDRKIRVDN